MWKPHKECTYTAEKASHSEKIEDMLILGKAVDNSVAAIPNLATGIKVSSSACDSAKTKHLTLK